MCPKHHRESYAYIQCKGWDISSYAWKWHVYFPQIIVNKTTHKKLLSILSETLKKEHPGVGWESKKILDNDVNHGLRLPHTAKPEKYNKDPQWMRQDMLLSISNNKNKRRLPTTSDKIDSRNATTDFTTLSALGCATYEFHTKWLSLNICIFIGLYGYEWIGHVRHIHFQGNILICWRVFYLQPSCRYHLSENAASNMLLKYKNVV